MELRHQNSYGMMRWIFALSVVYSHSFALSGHAGHGDIIARLTGHSVSDLGVLGFFILSGFLNSGSLQRAPTAAGGTAFLVRRSFRIFPLLWSMLLLAVASSWMIKGITKKTFRPAMDFLLGNGLLYLPQWPLPGLFEKNPNHAICGSLWTLPYEAFLYLILVASSLGQARGLSWINKAALAGMTCAMCLVMPVNAPVLFGGIQAYYLGYLGWAFLCGIALRKFPSYLESRTVVIASAVFLLLGLLIPAHEVAGWKMMEIFAFAVLVMKVGSRHWGGPARWMDRWDASYGIYLLSFPIQQILIASGLTSPYSLFLISAPLSAAAGLLTWRYLEKPMLEIGKTLSHRITARHAEEPHAPPHSVSRDPAAG